MMWLRHEATDYGSIDREGKSLGMKRGVHFPISDSGRPSATRGTWFHSQASKCQGETQS